MSISGAQRLICAPYLFGEDEGTENQFSYWATT